MNRDNSKGQETSEKKAIRVLIMTDCSNDAAVLRRYMSDFHRYNVETKYAANIAQALYRLRNERFSLIMLDSRHASDVSPKEVLETFQECKVDVPVVIITAVGDEQILTKGIKMGLFDHVTENDIKTGLLEKIIGRALNVLHRETAKDTPGKCKDCKSVLDKAQVSLKANGRRTP